MSRRKKCSSVILSKKKNKRAQRVRICVIRRASFLAELKNSESKRKKKKIREICVICGRKKLGSMELNVFDDKFVINLRLKEVRNENLWE